LESVLTMLQEATEGALDQLTGAAPRRDPARIGRIIAIAMGVAALSLIPWTVFLGFTLPRRYDAHHWSLLWIGFDIIVCGVLASFAWLTWKRRQLMAVMAIIAGTLLFCDAWFDVITAWGNSDSWVTLVTAFCAELPLAVFLYWVAYRIIRRSLAAYYALIGQAEHPPGLLRAPALLFSADAAPDSITPSRRLRQALNGARAITDELHGALDSLSLVSNDSTVDRCGIDKARLAIERALEEVEGTPV
jgi:hypothetical protein